MACVNLVTRAKMLYGVGMRRHRKSITTSPETIEAIVERTKLTLDLQIKLAHWLVEQEDRQNKFQFSVIASLLCTFMDGFILLCWRKRRL